MLTDNFGRKFITCVYQSLTYVTFVVTIVYPTVFSVIMIEKFLTLPEITRLASALPTWVLKKFVLQVESHLCVKTYLTLLPSVSKQRALKRVAITSNGFKLPEHLPSWLDAGIDAINISIDSLDPRQFHAITGHDNLSTFSKVLIWH